VKFRFSSLHPSNIRDEGAPVVMGVVVAVVAMWAEGGPWFVVRSGNF
jgi:CO dehydrogenase/acetyl-CoA synthase alpha subunit